MTQLTNNQTITKGSREPAGASRGLLNWGIDYCLKIEVWELKIDYYG